MDNQRAKEILRLYRPGTLDALDPQMAEALQEVQRDPALADWFNQQCGVCIALRSKLKQIEVPPDLKRKILLGNIGRRRVISLRRPAPILAAAAALALLAAGVWFMLTPKADLRFASYRERVSGLAWKGYQMSLFSTNLDDIHAFLDGKKWPADYVLPKNLEKLPVEGCANLDWHNRKYSMLCFDAGKNKDGKKKELYLLVAARAELQDVPAADKPLFVAVHDQGIMTATWVNGKNVYVLVGNREPDLAPYFD